ncbi:MAG: hypothetical protein ACXWRE_00875 [Pseudobdellovibrionaceae bacterium]
MDILNRSSQLFIKLMAFSASVLFSMSLQRLVLFTLVVRHWIFGADGLTIATSFMNGLRFDLCVLGFINIPVLFFTWIISSEFMVKTSSKVLQFGRQWLLWIYLSVVTLLIHLLGFFDLMFFAANSHRWTYYDWQESGLSFVGQVMNLWGGIFTFAVSFLFLTLWISRCIFTLYKLGLQGNRSGQPLSPPASKKFGDSKLALLTSGLVLPLLIVALAARGTWTAHHINIEHAEISQIQALNQMTLSPIWAFDKKF